MGAEAVEVEVEGFEVEWRIEAEGKHWRIDWRYGNQIERLLCNTLIGVSLRFQLPLLR